MTNEDLQQMARELDARGEAYAVVTVVRAVAPTSAYPGAQAIILADGRLHGWIGGGCARDLVIGAAKCAIEKGEPKLVRISNEQIYAGEDVEHYAMSCASNGSVELFIQPNNLGNALCVLGCTPAADEARFLAERLRIRLTDSPDDAPVVLVATQGQGDEEALEAALRSPAKHVLMIASRRKSDRLRTLMKMRGVDESQLARLQAPAGPDAGAKTPGRLHWWRSPVSWRRCAIECRGSRKLSQSSGRPLNEQDRTGAGRFRTQRRLALPQKSNSSTPFAEWP